MTDIARLPHLGDGFLTGSALARRVCRRLLLRKLSAIEDGCLRIVDRRSTTELGQPWAEAPTHRRATVWIHDDRFWPKAVFGGSIGVAEAFLDRQWTSDQLVAALRIPLRVRSVVDGIDRGFGRLLAPLRRAGQMLRANTRSGSRRNIRAHYDLSNEFFSLFLDRRLMYSAALFEPPEATLDQAAETKLERLCQKLDLSADDHLLEIGTGWGGFAIYAAETRGCRVTTTTVSPAQHAHALAEVTSRGLENRVTVRLDDYRDLRGQFDKVVSIEMIEAVGLDRLDEYFRVCAARLRPDGVMVLQAITIAEPFYEAAKRSVDFIQRYVFPGSGIPSVGAIVDASSEAGLTAVDLEDLGAHYARTLEAWRLRFLERIESVRALGFSPDFERLWEYYLAYCEAGFRERSISDVQLVLARSAARPTARAPLSFESTASRPQGPPAR